MIDKSTDLLYVIGGDGALYGPDLGIGRIRYGPVNFVAAYAKSASLNLVDGILYTTLAQGCGNALSGFYSVDVRNARRPVVQQLLLSNTNTAGIWGRGGPVIGDNGRIYGGTADGVFDPIAGDYSNALVAASRWRNRNLVAHGAEEGLVYLMDAGRLGSDHQTTLYTSPRLGNDRTACCEGLGIWGGLSKFRGADGQTWLCVPLGEPVAAEAPKFPIV